MVTPLRLGIIGCGAQGQRQIAAARALPDLFEVTGEVDALPRR